MLQSYGALFTKEIVTFWDKCDMKLIYFLNGEFDRRVSKAMQFSSSEDNYEILSLSIYPPIGMFNKTDRAYVN